MRLEGDIAMDEIMNVDKEEALKHYRYYDQSLCCKGNVSFPVV